MASDRLPRNAPVFTATAYAKKGDHGDLTTKLQVFHMLVGSQLDGLPFVEGRSVGVGEVGVLKSFLKGFEPRSVSLGSAHPDLAKTVPNLPPDFVYVTRDVTISNLSAAQKTRPEDNTTLRKATYVGSGFVVDVFTTTDVPLYALCHLRRTHSPHQFNYMNKTSPQKTSPRTHSPPRQSTEPTYVPISHLIATKPPPQSVIQDASYLIKVPDLRRGGPVGGIGYITASPERGQSPLVGDKPHCGHDMKCPYVDDRKHLDSHIHPCPRYFENGCCYLDTEPSHVAYFSHRLRRGGDAPDPVVQDVIDLKTPVPPTPLSVARPVVKPLVEEIPVSSSSIPMFAVQPPTSEPGIPREIPKAIGVNSYNTPPVIEAVAVSPLRSMSPLRSKRSPQPPHPAAAQTDWRDVFQSSGLIELDAVPNSVPPSMRVMEQEEVEEEAVHFPIMELPMEDDVEVVYPEEVVVADPPRCSTGFYPPASRRRPISTTPMGERDRFLPTKTNPGIPEPSPRPPGSVRCRKSTSPSAGRRHSGSSSRPPMRRTETSQPRRRFA